MLLSINVYPGPANPSNCILLTGIMSCVHMDPPLDSVCCCLLLMAGRPVSLKFSCVQLSQMHGQTQLHVLITASRALYCTLKRVSRAPAQPSFLRIALEMVQNTLAEQNSQECCTGAMSCHIQADSHAFCTS